MRMRALQPSAAPSVSTRRAQPDEQAAQPVADREAMDVALARRAVRMQIDHEFDLANEERQRKYDEIRRPYVEAMAAYEADRAQMDQRYVADLERRLEAARARISSLEYELRVRAHSKKSK